MAAWRRALAAALAGLLDDPTCPVRERLQVARVLESDSGGVPDRRCPD